MQNTFSSISTFQIRHEYFFQDTPGIFQFTVPKESKRSLLNLNFLVKPLNDGFRLVGGDTSLLKDEWNPIHFHFSIRDSLFVNYTDLENFKPGKSLIYLSNRNVFQSEKSGDLGFTKGEFLEKESVVSIQQGSIQLKELSTNDKYALHDETGELLQYVTPNGQMQNFPLSEGLYTISDEEISQTFYFFPQKIFKPPDLVFTIYPADLYDQIQENGSVHFEAKFKSRWTKWRYILTDPIYNKFQNLYVIDSKKKTFPFQEKKIELKGMGNFRCFESIENMMLQDLKTGVFQLVDNPDMDPKNEKIIIKNLPSASPDMLFQETFPQGDLYSNIFI